MMIAEATIDYSKIFALFPPGNDVFLHGQTYEFYENFIESIGAASGLRISFDGENIKIITLSTKHEKYVRFIER